MSIIFNLIGSNVVDLNIATRNAPIDAKKNSIKESSRWSYNKVSI